jgi:hypothetical protein
LIQMILLPHRSVLLFLFPQFSAKNKKSKIQYLMLLRIMHACFIGRKLLEYKEELPRHP